LVSHTWFGGTWQHPEPASFGDSLAQLERFVCDVRSRETGTGAPSPVLLGVDQGASLALSLALMVPDLITGVMAIGGGLPTFSDPTLLAPVEARLPILLLGDADGPPTAALEMTETQARLMRLGHQVTVRWLHRATALGEPVAAALRTWTRTQLGQGRGSFPAPML
jgi:predicted esterase